MFVQNCFLRAAALGRLVLLAGVALVLLARPGLAQFWGTPNTYNVTVNEFSLCADASCASKTTVISSSSVFNLAGAAPGAPAGDYVPAGTSIPNGTYSYFLISIGRAVGVVGRISNIADGFDCITMTTSGDVSVAGDRQSNDFGFLGTTTFTMPVLNGNLDEGVTASTAGGNITLIVPLAPPITVNDGDTMPAFGINFNIDTALGGVSVFGGCNMILGVPTIVIDVGGSTIVSFTLGVS
ncbi:hypothetical protein MNBD_ALPHA09-1003 [hydrothermal vent metagenome]|uniref:Uncharacterized protein n=1 Tax=hydrothermal vent metagenome TaxID=652676 RepID=A0A3B0T2E7_9ZZZZ